MTDAVLRVSFAGPLVTYQDAGREGQMRFGVPASGPMDRLSHAAANVALGNAPDCTAVEISVGGLSLECTSGALSLGVAGGHFMVNRAEESIGAWSVFALQKGERLTIRAGSEGSWAYLTFAGTVHAPKWLDHTATHSASGFGGGALLAGSTIRVSDTKIREERHGDIARPTFLPTKDSVRVVRGPQDRFFSDAHIETFFSAQYTLTDSFDRMGVRLSGPKLEVDGALSIPSEPITRGSVQVAGDGIPTVLLADHQTTGGYPKIATVISDDLDKVSQMRANDRMSFVEISPQDAVQVIRKSATDRTLYLAEIAEPKGTLDQRLMRENLISGAIAAVDA